MATRTDAQPTVRDCAAVAVLVAVIAGVMFRPLLASISSHFAINTRDAAFNSWVLAWGADALTRGFVGVWSPPIFFPYPNALAYSENLLGIALVVAPVQWLTGNPVLTYNVALLLSFVVAGVGAYLLALEITGSRPAAVIAALGFAFAPYRWMQLVHLQVLWTAWLPVVLWSLHRAIQTSRLSYWALFAVLFVLQVYSNGYAAFQAAVAVGCVAAVGVLLREVSWPKLVRLAVASAVVGLLLLPSAVVHVRVWDPQDTTPGDPDNHGADLSTYLSVAPDLPGAGWLPGVGQDEGNFYPGTVIVALALVGLVPFHRSHRASRWRWAYVAIALVGAVLSLGPEPRLWGQPLPLPRVYEWLASTVPLFDAQRVPSRFGVLVVLAANVLAACGASRVAGLLTRAAGFVLVSLLGVVIAFEGYGGPLRVAPYSIVNSQSEAAATEWLAAQPPGALLNLPLHTLGETSIMRQQFAVLQHRHPSLNGVSRIVTPLFELVSGSGSPLVVPELLPEAVPFLRGLGIRYLLIRPGEFYDASIAGRLTVALSRDPAAHYRQRFGEIAAWELDPLGEASGSTEGLTRIATENLTLTASDSPERLPLALDGNPETRWLTGHSQTGAEWMAIEFDRSRRLARLDFVIHSRSLIHFPRLIEVVSAGPAAGAQETVLYRGSILPALGHGWRRTPDVPVASILLPGHAATKIVIRQVGHSADWFWAVDELVLWARD